MAVTKWKAAGLKPVLTDERGREWFDLAAAKAWRETFMPDMAGLGRGGKRGGGRPPKEQAAKPTKATLTIPTEDGPKTVELSTDELQAFVADPTGEALTLLKAKIAKEQALAAKSFAEMAKIRGDLIPKTDVENEWTRMLTAFDRLLTSTPARMVPRLVHAAQIAFDPEGPHAGKTTFDRARLLTTEFESILREGINQTKTAIVADPFGERDAA